MLLGKESTAMQEERMAKQTELAQPAPETPKKPNLFRRIWNSKARKWVIIALILVAGGGIAVKKFQNNVPQAAAVQTAFQTAQAERRDITKSLSSSGTLQPADSYTVSTLISAEILSDTFEEGDLVEKGQLLYTLDSSDATSNQTQAQNNYAQAQNNYAQTQNSYTQAQNSYDQAVKSKYPTADMSGSVSEVYVSNGDTVNAGTQLLKIVGDNNIYVDLQFTYADSSKFYVGQPATLFINGFAGTTSGTVVAVSDGASVSSTGMVMTAVRVKATNPGLVTTDYTATAVIGDYTSYGNAAIKISESTIVTAETSGKVADMNWMTGDTISSGDRICTITGDSIDNQIENAKISVENAKTSIKNAETNIDNAKASLSNAQDKLDDYKVTAPISGTVVTKTAKAGDKIEGGSTGTLCTIYDLSYLEMTMSIDELDISEVEVGQTVSITADAVEGKTYTGVVTKVSVAGNTTNGITTYPVTVRIDETDGLRPGMNVDAEIVIENRTDALAIPASAVNRGNTVLVTADSPSAANGEANADGYVSVSVETGISDDSYIEILSGLQEGDTVAYIQASSSSGDSFMMGGPGMGGGMGGDMGGGPGGGGPGGGGPGGGF